MDLLLRPWPWWIGGPAIGLIVPLLLILGGRMFGISSSLRHVCAATLPGDTNYLRYDWRSVGGWNLLFALGAVIGGALAGTVFRNPEPMALAPSAIATFESLGLDASGFMVPAAIFSAEALSDWRALAILVGGGFLVGFGARWADGCTSGHAISGLATMQLPSMIAVVGFFAGGLVSAHLILPLLLGGMR